VDESDWWSMPHIPLLTTVRWGISCALLGILLIFVDLQEVYQVLRSADALFLVVAVGISLGDRLLMAGKWLPLLRVQIPKASLGKAIRAYFAAGFAGIFLPASGDDLLRSIGLGQNRSAVMEVGASVVMERLLGLLGSGIVALLVIWVAIQASIPISILLPWALACIGGSLMLAAVPFSARIRHSLKSLLDHFRGRGWVDLIERFGEAYEAYREHRKMLFFVGLLSIMEQFAPVLVFWAGAQALQLNLSFTSLFVAVPLTIFAARLPVSVAGIGIIEGGLVYLLGLFGVASSQAVSLALLDRVVGLLTMLPGAFWWNDLARTE